jgi:hypothetical protein
MVGWRALAGIINVPRTGTLIAERDHLEEEQR